MGPIFWRFPPPSDDNDIVVDDDMAEEGGEEEGKGGGEGSIVDDVFDVMEGTCSGEEEESRRRCPTGEGDSCVGRGNTESAT